VPRDAVEPTEKFLKSGSPFGDKAHKKALKATQKKKKKKLAAEAKARAKRRQVELRGDDTEAEDMGKLGKKFKGFSKSALMLVVAKGVMVGKPTTIKKRDWYTEMCNRAEALRHEGQTKEAAFAKFITSNPDGRLLFAVYKQAPGNDWEGEDDEELDDMANPEADDPAYAKLCAKARALMEQNPQLSFPQAFSICYTTNSSLVDMSKRYHAQKVAKAWMPATGHRGKADVGNGFAGNQTTGLDQYQRLMAEAERLNAEGRGKGRSVAQIFSDLWQNKGSAIPGQDQMGTGKDKSTRLQSADKMTAQRLRTTKSFNPNQRPIRLAGAEGWSR
jgi:hypothetical protein